MRISDSVPTDLVEDLAHGDQPMAADDRSSSDRRVAQAGVEPFEVLMGMKRDSSHTRLPGQRLQFANHPSAVSAPSVLRDHRDPGDYALTRAFDHESPSCDSRLALPGQNMDGRLVVPVFVKVKGDALLLDEHSSANGLDNSQVLWVRHHAHSSNPSV